MRMYRILMSLLLATVLIAGLHNSLFAQDQPETGNAHQEKMQQTNLFSYNPPKRGAPGNRIGGGTRGEKDDIPLFSVLVPEDHVGLTTRDKPVLCWYISGPTSKQMEFSLNDEAAGETLLQMNLEQPKAAGAQMIDLSRYDIRLSPGKKYIWFVTMAVDPNKPSKDIFSGGAIEFVPPAGQLAEKLKKAGDNEKPAIFAEEGIWYDALSYLSRRIENDPENVTLRKQRIELIRRAGLENVAELMDGR